MHTLIGGGLGCELQCPAAGQTAQRDRCSTSQREALLCANPKHYLLFLPSFWCFREHSASG